MDLDSDEAGGGGGESRGGRGGGRIHHLEDYPMTFKWCVSKNRGTPKRMVYNGKPY